MKLILITESIVDNVVVGMYFIYKIPVKRGIRGKTKGKVDEIIVYGIPIKKLPQFVQKHEDEIREY